MKNKKREETPQSERPLRPSRLTMPKQRDNNDQHLNATHSVLLALCYTQYLSPVFTNE